MATTRTIDSPGVQIQEIDLSIRPVQNAATTIFIPGFSQKGPTEEAIKITSLSEFEQVYGVPTNAAERYFYYTVRAAFQSPADIMVTRMPYGSGSGVNVSENLVGVLAYPAVFSADGSAPSNSTQTYSQTGGTYFIGAPRHYALTKQQYTDLLNGSLFTYSNTCSANLDSNINSLSSAAIIIANQSQTVINNLYEGYYIGLSDNTSENPNSDFDTIIGIKTITTNGTSNYIGQTGYQIVPTDRIYNGVRALTATKDGNDGTLSEVQEQRIASFSLYTSAFSDTLKIGLYKFKQSVFADNSIQLTWAKEEGYAGSLDSHRVENNPIGGPASSFFIESIARGSTNIAIKINPYLSRTVSGGGYQDVAGVPTVKIRVANPGLAAANSTASFVNLSATAITQGNAAFGTNEYLFPAGVFSSADLNTKNCGNVPAKLNRIFQRLSNSDIYAFDVACEAGLGTVYACSSANNGIFDDYRYLNVNNLSADSGAALDVPARNAYKAVVDEFVALAENNQRKDFVVIADPLTPIFVQSNSVKTMSDPALQNTFATSIFWPLKNLYAGINTSYVTTYATCVKVNDIVTGRDVWVPFSGFAAAAMANTDATYQPWYVPAGFTRGTVSNILDVAIYPRQKERDQLYKEGFNPVAFFPTEGFVIYGQKTLLRRPSAFDRLNVRRLFLSLEKATRQTLNYFVFEPNTLLTRTQIVNTLTPIFENAKNTEGLYDYLIICDERNNTPAVIDDNTIIVDIYIKPVRSAEFILANFYATRTGINFQEVVA